MRDAVDDLIWDEAPGQAGAVALLDAPALVDEALTLTADVRVWCDDWRDAAKVPAKFLVEHPTDLAGVDLALARLPKSLGALDEMATNWMLSQRRYALERDADAVLDLFFHGVSGPQPQGGAA